MRPSLLNTVDTHSGNLDMGLCSNGKKNKQMIKINQLPHISRNMDVIHYLDKEFVIQDQSL